jgi:hypothetical protein
MSETKILTIQEAMEITQDIPEIFAQILDFFDAEVEFVELGVKGDQIIVREVEKSNPTVSSVHVPSTDWNKDNLLLAKAMDDEKRYTLAPWYVPDVLDAHDEWTDKEEVQRAFWDYLKRDDRSIRLQHNMDIIAGEWVEGLTWPHAVTVPIKHPEGDTEITFPAGTPFLGVIWEPWAWQLIKDGEIRGLSIGGRGRRMEADPEDYDYDPMGKVSFTKMIQNEGGKYVVYSDDGSRSFGTYDTKEEAEERLRQIEYFAKADFKTGDFVSWNSSGGRARGKIERIEIDGEINVPDSSFTITGTNEEPAALITVWREDSDGWNETDRKVGHKLDALTPIDALQKAETFKPPQAVIDNAKRALEWISEGEAGSGFTGVGRRRASQLANGEAVSLETIKRIYSFLSRHENDSKAEGFERGEKNYPSAGRVAWDAWGGDEAMAWSRSISERFEKHMPNRHDQSSHGRKNPNFPRVTDKVAQSIRNEEAVSRAIDLRAKYSAVENGRTELLSSLATSRGGEMTGLEYRLKDTDSLARKIEADSVEKKLSMEDAASRIYDVNRYTMQFDTQDFTANAQSTMSDLENEGFRVVEIKNTLKNADAQYRGVNVKLEKDGLGMELQFHTPESNEAKKVNHDLYAVYREETNPRRQAGLDRRMRQNAAAIPTPPDINLLGA